MARSHYWQYLINEEGQPIQSANIRIYKAGSTTPAYVYTQEVGGTATNSIPQVSTNSNGFFEFWIADASDTLGYAPSQKFKIQWQKTGITTGVIDNVNIFQVYDGVDTADTDATLNKLVSNLLAKRWEDHRNDVSHLVHGIGEVDVTDTDTTKDRLVSNSLAKGWEDHKDDESYYLHGIEAVDPYDTDTTDNKLVSNLLMNTLLTLATSAVSGATTTNATINTWTASGDEYKADINHTHSNDYLVVQCYDASTDQQIFPAEIESINPNKLRIFMPDNTVNLEVVIIG